MSELRGLHMELQDAISCAKADASRLAVLVIHIDGLNEVHATIGRWAGEVLLNAVEERWSSALTPQDSLAHLGRGEFALLIPGATERAASEVAEALLRVLERPIDVRGALVQLSGSIGIAVYPEHADHAEALLRRADVAAIDARQSPRSYALYVAEEDHTSPERLALAADLRRAIEQNQLLLQYQPQVDVRTGALTAVEALVRWQHPSRGLLSPDEFIPLGEKTRLIRPLTRFVLQAAVQQCRAWQADGLEVRVAVNLSVHDLQDLDLPDYVAELLRTYGVSPDRLCVEITESALLADPRRALEILVRLRGFGVNTAIDDFGTGYSSLAYLKDLPLDELKIDRSFVQDMAHDAGARAIVRAVIDLAHDLGLKAIAEGIEDQATREVLASLGCDIGQGYYFSPPLCPEGLTEWVKRGIDRGLDDAQRNLADVELSMRSRARRAGLRAEEEFLARKRAEAALRASEAQYRTVVDSIKDVIFQVDSRKCWSFLNRAWEEVTGFSCEESLGRLALEFVHPEDRERPRALFRGIANGTEANCRFEIRFLTRQGDFKWLEVFAHPTISKGRIVGVHGTLSDITDRKQAEERRRALEQTERLRALGQMASGVAHDLNQSLGLIAGYGHIALRALDQAEPDLVSLREALPVITQAATDGGETVRRLLTFGRGQTDGEPERLDVGELLRQVAGLTAPRWRDAAQAERRPISLQFDVEPELFISGRSASLSEALTNLIFNAVDAMPDGGSITLAARQTGDRVVIEVTDSGVGIDPQVQAHIFEPFFSTKGERGTGLGLAQVFGIVEQHGAEVSVDSAPGRGTTFRLTFAGAGPAHQLTDARAPAPQMASRRLRILAVDDEPAMGSMIRRILHPDGHTVVTATTGEEALERLAVESFDVVISDVGMGPRMNGWDLAEEIRRHKPGLPLVLATGWGATIDPAEAMAKGIHAVLAKPYQPAELQNILARLTTEPVPQKPPKKAA